MPIFHSRGGYKSPISPWAVVFMTAAGLATIALLVTVIWLRSGKSGWSDPNGPVDQSETQQKVISQWS